MSEERGSEEGTDLFDQGLEIGEIGLVGEGWCWMEEVSEGARERNERRTALATDDAVELGLSSLSDARVKSEGHDGNRDCRGGGI